jgi:HPt (histidine-containing phosphotransfer) domain-containing protein
MNAHVGKPFDLNDLVVLLRQLTGRRGEVRTAPARPHPVPAAAAALADELGVRLGDALARLDGNTRLYVELLSSFVARIPPAVAELDLSLQEGRRQAASRSLHAIKGLAGTLGLARIVLETARAEAASREDAGAASFRDAIAGFCALLVDASPGLTRLLACLAGGARPESSLASVGLIDVVPELVRILELLRASDMASLAAVATLGRRAGAQLGEEFALLVEAVDLLRFEEAADRCDGLVARLTTR